MKVTVVGAGAIGSALAYSLCLQRPEWNVEIVNRSEPKAWAKAFDMGHCRPAWGSGTITSVPWGDDRDADAVVLCTGVLPAPTGSRSDVLGANIALLRSIVPGLCERHPKALFVNVVNPVDSITYAIAQITGALGRFDVLGSGTELDSQRLRTFVAAETKTQASLWSIPVVGEHGDSMVALWSLATYQGQPAADLESWPLREACLERTRRAGWKIREAGEHSCYGIAQSVARILMAVHERNSAPLLVSAAVTQGERTVFASLPTTWNEDGLRVTTIPRWSVPESDSWNQSLAILAHRADEVDRFLALPADGL